MLSSSIGIFYIASNFAVQRDEISRQW